MPFTKSLASGDVSVACVASIKLPKFATDSFVVDREALSGDLEFAFGVTNGVLNFPKDKT